MSGDTGASVKATRFGDWGRRFGDRRASGETAGTGSPASANATRFGDLGVGGDGAGGGVAVDSSSVRSEMLLRRLE